MTKGEEIMHMADALLSPAVGATMYVASAGSIGGSIRKIQKDTIEKKIPLMAVSGAFVFASQMINFTIPGTGSSGHIGGGILLSALLGGPEALLTIAAVLIIQCLFFADGGLLALGANIFNMGVIPALIIFPLIFKPILQKKMSKGRLAGASILSAVIGLQLGAFGVVVETLLSGVTELPFSQFVVLMQPIHLAIGLVEGVLTAGVLYFVYQAQPEIIKSSVGLTELSREKESDKKAFKKVIIGLAIASVVIGGALSLIASSNPDGLEWAIGKVAQTEELEREGGVYDTVDSIQSTTSILPDYDFASGSEGAGTSFSGIVGGLMTFVLAGGVAVIIQKTKKSKA